MAYSFSYTDNISAKPYCLLDQAITIENLIMALRLKRMGRSREYIAEFVSGAWSPQAYCSNPMHVPKLILPLKPSSYFTNCQDQAFLGQVKDTD